MTVSEDPDCIGIAYAACRRAIGDHADVPPEWVREAAREGAQTMLRRFATADSREFIYIIDQVGAGWALVTNRQTGD